MAESALLEAVCKSGVERDVVAALMAVPGLYLHTRDRYYERTALILAARHQTGPTGPAVVSLLAERLDVNARDVYKNTALMLAVEYQRGETAMGVVSALLDAPGIDASLGNYSGKTALMLAVEHQPGPLGLEMVRALLAAPGAEKTISAVTNDGWTALMLAAEYQTDSTGVDVVRALLNAPGMNVNVAAPDTGWTALMSFSRAPRVECLAELLNVPGLDIHARNEHQETALMVAVECRLDETGPVVVQMLLDAGSSVHACDEEGQTALMIAASCQIEATGPAVVAALLSAGSDPLIRDCRGQRASDLADEFESLSVLELLRVAEYKCALRDLHALRRSRKCPLVPDMMAQHLILLALMRAYEIPCHENTFSGALVLARTVEPLQLLAAGKEQEAMRCAFEESKRYAAESVDEEK